MIKHLEVIFSISLVFLVGLSTKLIFGENYSSTDNHETYFEKVSADVPSGSTSSSSADGSCGAGTGDGDSACCGPCE